MTVRPRYTLRARVRDARALACAVAKQTGQIAIIVGPHVALLWHVASARAVHIVADRYTAAEPPKRPYDKGGVLPSGLRRIVNTTDHSIRIVPASLYNDSEES